MITVKAGGDKDGGRERSIPRGWHSAGGGYQGIIEVYLELEETAKGKCFFTQ